MKKIIMILAIVILTMFAGCSSSQPQNLDCENYKNGDSWQDDCNTCTCTEGNIACTEIACNVEEETNNSLIDDFKDQVNAWKFNSDLTDYEQKWLKQLESENPNSRIIFMKSDVYSCDGCYDLYYKKDRTIIKIKVLDGELKQQSTITDDIVPLIENENICQLFSGTWNDCPAPCTTDEEACTTMCNPPICEFDENKIVYKKLGEECGGLDKGDCEFGLTCSYKTKDDEYGVCKSI